MRTPRAPPPPPSRPAPRNAPRAPAPGRWRPAPPRRRGCGAERRVPRSIAATIPPPPPLRAEGRDRRSPPRRGPGRRPRRAGARRGCRARPRRRRRRPLRDAETTQIVREIARREPGRRLAERHRPQLRRSVPGANRGPPAESPPPAGEGWVGASALEPLRRRTPSPNPLPAGEGLKGGDAQFLEDSVELIDILRHVAVPEANDAVAVRFDDAGAFSIRFGGLGMLSAVELAVRRRARRPASRCDRRSPRRRCRSE